MSSRGKRKRYKANKAKRPAWTPFEPCQPIRCGVSTLDTDLVFRNSRYQVFVYLGKTEMRHDMDVVMDYAHLSIKTHDRSPVRDWRDMQRIKNELCGTTCEAVELYPNENRLVDMANQYHLWCLPPGMFSPFGFNDGRIVSSDNHPLATKVTDEKIAEALAAAGSSHTVEQWKEMQAKARQRDDEPHHNTDGCLEVGPVWSHYKGQPYDRDKDHV